ncbi:dephospho-CoA kinase [Acidianus manzaensis]|uniref:Dephospho-CoA kinase n=2 Tax=Acidianus manzaensis TaxID=282676 RepID=A0A1W6K1R4_9CREN|nr:dephospho-CoA kinase [Acidianus manzaensis]
MPGSGKSLLSDILKERGYTVISMSGVLRKRYEKEAKIGEKLMDFAKRMREIYGDGVVARLCIEEVSPKLNKIAFDGVRSLSEVEEFKRLGEPIIIAVHSPPSVRYNRIISRMRPDDSKNISELRLRDMDELKFGIGGVIAMADYIIVNDSTIDEFKKRADELLSRILK